MYPPELKLVHLKKVGPGLFPNTCSTRKTATTLMLNCTAASSALVLVGVIDTIPAFSSRLLIGGRKSLSGSAIGGIAETQELLDFCAAKGVAADCEMTTMPRINEAFERMARGDVRYRFVIDMQTL